MENLQEKIYAKSPHFIQNWIVSLYNVLAYRKRYSGKYKHFVNYYLTNRNLSVDQLNSIQANRYTEFVKYAKKYSEYYSKILGDIAASDDIANIAKLPIINKETLRSNYSGIYTIQKSEGIVSKTGGTTGKSLEVLYTHDDVQEQEKLLLWC